MCAQPLSSFDVDPQFDGIPDHRGNIVQPPFLFLADTSPEIGALESAESTIRQGEAAPSIFKRLLMVAFVVAVILIVTGLIATFIDDRSVARRFLVVDYFLVPAGIIVEFLRSRFRATCSYVGRDGVKRAVAKGSLASIPWTEVLVFAQAAVLYHEEVRHEVHGFRFNTIRKLVWRDADNRPLFRVRASYYEGGDLPDPGDSFLFARVVEAAWSRHYLRRAEAQLQTCGMILFQVEEGPCIRVRPGSISFELRNAVTTVTPQEIAQITLFNGIFSFKLKDAKLLTGEGKYKFEHAAMANAKAFLMVLERLVGYRWDGRKHFVLKEPIPVRPIQSMRGLVSGMDTTIERDEDRL